MARCEHLEPGVTLLVNLLTLGLGVSKERLEGRCGPRLLSGVLGQALQLLESSTQSLVASCHNKKALANNYCSLA